MKFTLLVFVFAVFIKQSIQEYNFLEFNDVSPKPGAPKQLEAHTTRIYGSMPAAAKQFPYQAGIMAFPKRRVIGVNNVTWCGGVVITNQYVLTAAHCLFDNENGLMVNSLDIYLGALNKSNSSEVGQQRIIIPSRHYFIVHENFNYFTLSDDIALVQLPDQVEFNEYISPARLPTQRKDRIRVPITSSGWGRRNENKNSVPDILHKATLQIIPSRNCYQTYPDFDDRKQICINTNGASTCKGDSGGPHIITGPKSEPVLVGITSYGHREGCTQGYPQVLTRVSYYLNWILKHGDFVLLN